MASNLSTSTNGRGAASGIVTMMQAVAAAATSATSSNTAPGTAANIALQSQLEANVRVAQEFQDLQRRAHELFTGLKDLPTTVSPKIWKPYFNRTFSVFTKLWKFQQANRAALELEDCYGLKRHEVGEIASKVGQLYYHYYLRTSDTGHLLEAYTFYEAILDRHYFDDVMDTKIAYVAAKRLRYCARFMIVCMLLNRLDRVQVLVVEMKKLVDQFAKELDPDDKEGWRKTYREMAMFVEALNDLPTDDQGRLCAIQPRAASRENRSGKTMVHDVVIASCWPNQPRFSDLSIDMFRFLQLLEREPVKPQPDQDDSDAPRKSLLNCPSASQIIHHLGSSLRDISSSQFLLFYYSGPGRLNGAPASGGTATIPPSEAAMLGGLDTRPPGDDHVHRLHPYDLVPFTRKPFFCVLDSPAAPLFRKTPNLYTGTPFLFLCSPQEYPPSISGHAGTASLFTAFLFHPVVGIASVCRLERVAASGWAAAIEQAKDWEAAVVRYLQEHPLTPAFLHGILTDEFLARLVARFVVCRVVLTHNTCFLKTTELPCCHPDLSDTLWTDLEVLSTEHLALTLGQLGCQDHFR
ncbi:hypothetical protein AMAG_09662 [Allomyces macrogynus ATCC 38327]|uniref:Protein SCAI n=1 Tax=Allomyces macrogynus (strain ATCC 38327) TaxID=578462 RepID=A0A0L0ST39_ALLM3|nr:hypothetical protein AMAG_09662 [Allomyces macrogynus ATCC 38327]|eukprot:KNE65677.1 hypothetical protein AMAG_09662 [Allomyces macrogynus ATCC 38327]